MVEVNCKVCGNWLNEFPFCFCNGSGRTDHEKNAMQKLNKIWLKDYEEQMKTIWTWIKQDEINLKVFKILIDYCTNK